MTPLTTEARAGVAAPSSYARQNAERFVAELMDFVRFPSVSAQARHDDDIRACAAWLAGHLRRVGMENVSVIRTPRHPIVCADWLHAAGRPTVLLYGHYDVQPPDPLAEWRTPPFEPAVRDGNLYGRGASDDKGQMFCHVKALESFLRTAGALPVNVKCLFEGEEEIGSPNLEAFLRRDGDALRADLAVMSDMWMLSSEQPAITYSLRGALSLELEVRGPLQDLHSGNFGGAVHNPLQALCEIIAGLHDARGRVTVRDFYTGVREVSAVERAYMARHGPSDEEILRATHARAGWGEEGYSLYERLTIRPALTVNGITGGYQGEGAKAVIPARASAKINIRLAPSQDPQIVERLVRQHVRRFTPPTVRAAVRGGLAAKPALMARDHPAMRAAAWAYRQVFGVSPVYLRSGGTIPAVNTFQEVLGLPTVMMNFALPDDRIHAPNEKFHLPIFFKGIDTSLHFLSAVARLRLPRPQAA